MSENNPESTQPLPPTYLPGWHDTHLVRKMRYTRLGETDLMVSLIGFGGCVVGGVYPDKGDLEEIFQCVDVGLRSGINFIDTSPFYGDGKSEEVLGEALRRVPRHTYYIATKVGRYSSDWKKAFDFSAETVVREFENSLQRLQLTYVDLVQVHDFEFRQDPEYIARVTLPAVRRIVESGKARYCGITGYPLQEFRKVLDLCSVRVDTVLSYTRNTFIDKSLEDYVPYFKSKKIGIINASPTGMGLLTNAGPPVWHPASSHLKALCSRAGADCAARGVELGKLSVHHNITNLADSVATTLLGVGRMEILRINLDIVMEGLSALEQEVMEEMKEKYFSGLTDTTWDYTEIEKYNKAINS